MVGLVWGGALRSLPLPMSVGIFMLLESSGMPCFLRMPHLTFGLRPQAGTGKHCLLRNPGKPALTPCPVKAIPHASLMRCRCSCQGTHSSLCCAQASAREHLQKHCVCKRSHCGGLPHAADVWRRLIDGVKWRQAVEIGNSRIHRACWHLASRVLTAFCQLRRKACSTKVSGCVIGGD